MLQHDQQQQQQQQQYTASYNTPVSVAFINDANANTNANASAFKGNYEESALLSMPVLRDNQQHHSNNAAAANPSNANANPNDAAPATAVTYSTRTMRTRVSFSKRKRSPDGYDYDYNHHDAGESSSTSTSTITSTSTTSVAHSNQRFQFPLVAAAAAAHSQTTQQSQAQEYAPTIHAAPLSIMEHYLYEHSSLRSFDPEDSKQLLQGASALCMMKEHQQIGVGSTSYSLKYGLDMIYHDNYNANNDADSNGIGNGKDNNTDTNANLYYPPVDNDESYNAQTNTRTRTHSTRKGRYTVSTTPTRLSLGTDLEVQNLNSLHQFVRAELLEVFVLPGSTSVSASVSASASQTVGRARNQKESFSNPKSVSRRSFRNNTATDNSPPGSISVSPPPTTSYASHRQYPGRVGLRCVHCANSKKASSGSCFFPKNIADIYRSVCTWQRVHFQHCSSVPTCEKEKYSRLKTMDKTRGKTKYWETSAKAIGLVDSAGSAQAQGQKGIIFDEC